MTLWKFETDSHVICFESEERYLRFNRIVSVFIAIDLFRGGVVGGAPARIVERMVPVLPVILEVTRTDGETKKFCAEAWRKNARELMPNACN